MKTFGEPQTVEVDGTTYKLARFELPLVEAFLEWSKTVLPNAYEEIAPLVDKLPEPALMKLLDRAEKRMSLRGTMQDAETMALLNSPKGVVKILSLLFQEHHPELGEMEIIQIVNRIPEERLKELVNTSQGTFRRVGKAD